MITGGLVGVTLATRLRRLTLLLLVWLMCRYLAVGYSTEADNSPACLIYDAQMPMKWSAKPRRLVCGIAKSSCSPLLTLTIGLLRLLLQALQNVEKAGRWYSVLEFSNNNQLLFGQVQFNPIARNTSVCYVLITA